MEKGYVENGFIVDLANAQKTSEIIYELSRILDMPEAKNKKVCLKLGNIDLNITELISIRALIETMDSEIEFIQTSSNMTEESAKDLDIKISKIENVVPALDINAKKEEHETVNAELESALDKIFGEGDFEERYPEEDDEPKKSEASKEVEVVRIEESDMYLYPDNSTWLVFPWGEEHGKVARVICSVHMTDGTPFAGDPRNALISEVKKMEDAGFKSFNIGPEREINHNNVISLCVM